MIEESDNLNTYMNYNSILRTTKLINKSVHDRTWTADPSPTDPFSGSAPPLSTW